MIIVTITAEVNYLVVGLPDFTIWRSLFCIYVCSIKFFGCTICLVSDIAIKVAMPSPDSFTIL